MEKGQCPRKEIEATNQIKIPKIEFSEFFKINQEESRLNQELELKNQPGFSEA